MGKPFLLCCFNEGLCLKKRYLVGFGDICSGFSRADDTLVIPMFDNFNIDFKVWIITTPFDYC